MTEAEPDTNSEGASARAERIEFVAGHLLARAGLLVRLLVKQVHNSEISRTEGEVLRILSDSPRRITDLAALEGVAQPTMTLLIRRLEARGWVSRAGVPEDGRIVMVSITPRGRAVGEAFRAEFLVALRADLEALEDEQLLALATATETLGSFLGALQQ